MLRICKAGAYATRPCSKISLPRLAGAAPGNRGQTCKAIKAEDLVTEIDIVLYASSQQAPCLGRLLRVLSDGKQVVLEPLAEEEEGLWVAAEDAPEVVVPTNNVYKVLAYELSQRQDKVSNPHGEHAHDVYRILEPVKDLLQPRSS